MKSDMVCYCGHDCARCIIYAASCNDDAQMRAAARSLYRDEFNIVLPEEAFSCAGGRSNEVFGPCAECPFRNCCKEKGIEACAGCAEYPCDMLSEYQKKYVNKFGLI